MKVVIKTPLLDLLAFILHLKKRNRIFRKASRERTAKGKMNILAQSLHPSRQILKIDSISAENDNTITYRLKPADDSTVAYFRAGQYISIDIDIDGTGTSRSYSLSSAPDDALVGNFYEITIKTDNDGFVSPHIKSNWKPGSIVHASEPMGYFYYEPLRDSSNLIFLAGGTGITPFRSLILDSLTNYTDVNITLFYGIHKPSDINFEDSFNEMKTQFPGRFNVVFVCDDPTDEWGGERGYITSDLILKYVADVSDHSFFICGPQAFHRFIDSEIQSFNIDRKFIRRDSFNIPANRDNKMNPLLISVAVGSENITIKSDPAESVLTALERAGLNPPASCRTGECGWCRSKLVSGDIRVTEMNDGRRMADKKFGYFHPCSSFALTDLKIVCNENPRKIIKE